MPEILTSAANIGQIYSNYDATQLELSNMFGLQMSDAVPVVGSQFSPGSDGNQWQQVPIMLTLTTSVGYFDIHTLDDYGVTDSNTTSFTWNGSVDDLTVGLGYVQLIVPPDYQGNVTISIDSNNTIVTVDQNSIVQSVAFAAATTQFETISVVPYTDPFYEATLQDQKALAGGGGQGVPAPSPTGVKAGINWTTLKMLGAGTAKADDGNGKTYVINGTLWTVNTVLGSPVALFEAAPMANQPAATLAIPSFTDPSYNCHGYSFGATGIVTPDGVSHSFQITDADLPTGKVTSIKNILSDAYTKLTFAEAWDASDTKPIIFVFVKDGEYIHSAVHFPGQTFHKQYYNIFIGYGAGNKTVLNSKNGDQTFTANTTFQTLWATYGKCDIQFYVAK